MAYIKIEPSGCVIHKGNIQVRLSMYLEPTDPRYNEHHVFVVDETSQQFLNGYKGKMTTEGIPVDQADYDAWIAGLPHIWRDNPFNNHFIYVDGNITITELKQKANDSFQEFFTCWSLGMNPIDVWHSKVRPVFVVKQLNEAEAIMTEYALREIKAIVI